MVALVQDRVVDDVARGENRGRRLSHSAVVRHLSAIASTSDIDAAVTAKATLLVSPLWNLPDMRAIALLQERDGRRIIGAGSTTINRPQLKENTR